jgi:hypothetical protein
LKELLVPFGWLCVISSSLLILVPYLRRRGDLITTWTLFQVGLANFLGIAAIQSGHALAHAYVAPRSEDYVKLMAGGALFYVVSALTYHFFRWPAARAQTMFTKWAPRDARTVLLLVPLCALFAMGWLLAPKVQVVGQILPTLGQYASIAAVCFCLCAWAQRPWNGWLAALAGITFLLALVVGNAGFGRQYFLSTLATIPICWYWLRGRVRNPGSVIVTLSIFAMVSGVALTGLSIVRGVKQNPDLSIAAAAWQKLKSIPTMATQGDSSTLFGGDSVDASLAAIQLYDIGEPTQPFFTLRWIAVNPIPRAWWPEKPEALGYTLPIDVGYVRMHGEINLGPGIIGHCFHEGGYLFVIFYAVLFAAIMRFADALISRDPNNPYLLAMFAGASGHILGFARGDIALFSMLILVSIVTIFILNLLTRAIFGTQQWRGAEVVPMTAPYIPPGYDYESNAW